MPETMIIYRYFFEWLGLKEGIAKAKEIIGHSLDNMSVQAWWRCYNECKNSVAAGEWININQYIHTNNFDKDNHFDKPQVKQLVSFYQNNRKSIIEPGTELYQMKQEYDENPTMILTRHG